MKNIMNTLVSQESAVFILIVSAVFHPSVFAKTQEILGRFVKVANGTEPTFGGLVIHALVAFALYTYVKKSMKKNA